jgi:O-antigen/teichoic acid export membrane protein
VVSHADDIPPLRRSKVAKHIVARLRGHIPSWTGSWLRDAGLLTFSQLIAVLATTALAILLARSLGPSEWGLFSGFLGLSFALGVFIDLGLGTWLLRDLAALRTQSTSSSRETQIESSRRLMSAFAANVAIGLLLVVVALIATLWMRSDVETVTALVSLLIYTIFLTASNCLEAFFRAERKLGKVVTAVILEKFLLLSLAGGVLLLGHGLWAIGLVYLCGGLARLIYTGLNLFARERLPLLLPGIPDVRRVITAGLPFAIGTVALNVIPRLDTILVASFSATYAGYFALGDRITGPALIVPAVAGAALYPFFSREAPKPDVAWKISGGMMAIGGTAAIIGAVLAPVVVPLIFGHQYSDAVVVVQLMLFILPFLYGSNPILTYTYARGSEREVQLVTFIASLLGTAAIITGLLMFGAVGAAAGYVLRHVFFTITLGGVLLFAVPSTRALASTPASSSPATRVESSGSEIL